MSIVESFRLEDYTLHCSASVVDNGGYMPMLMVASNAWPSRPRNIAVKGRDFLTEADARASAHAQGLAWIADFGSRRPPLSPGARLQDGRQSKHKVPEDSKDEGL
jgi:hypothetical protein